MATISAGILAFRWKTDGVEFLLVHPGGPFFAKKDAGAWSIPKGVRDNAEGSLEAARREFAEETGVTLSGDARDLGQFKQPSGKLIEAWLTEADLDTSTMSSNTFKLEWPLKSGKQQEFPEVDRYGWFKPDQALGKISKGQVGIVKLAMEVLEVPQDMTSQTVPSSPGPADPQGSLF